MGWLMLVFSGYCFWSAWNYSDVNHFKWPDEPDITDEPTVAKVHRWVHLVVRAGAGIALLGLGVSRIV